MQIEKGAIIIIKIKTIKCTNQNKSQRRHLRLDVNAKTSKSRF